MVCIDQYAKLDDVKYRTGQIINPATKLGNIKVGVCVAEMRTHGGDVIMTVILMLCYKLLQIVL